jgi:hypothetical protein
MVPHEPVDFCSAATWERLDYLIERPLWDGRLIHHMGVKSLLSN